MPIQSAALGCFIVNRNREFPDPASVTFCGREITSGTGIYRTDQFDQVTQWPFSVNLCRGYPRYNPGEFSANELIERAEADLCLLVGGESVPEKSLKARRHHETIPTILLDYPTMPNSLQPQVKFTTAVYGIHFPGTAYRMDDVPIPVRQVVSSDAEVLNRIREQVTELPHSLKKTEAVGTAPRRTHQ